MGRHPVPGVPDSVIKLAPLQTLLQYVQPETGEIETFRSCSKHQIGNTNHAQAAGYNFAGLHSPAPHWLHMGGAMLRDVASMRKNSSSGGGYRRIACEASRLAPTHFGCIRGLGLIDISHETGQWPLMLRNAADFGTCSVLPRLSGFPRDRIVYRCFPRAGRTEYKTPKTSSYAPM